MRPGPRTPVVVWWHQIVTLPPGKCANSPQDCYSRKAKTGRDLMAPRTDHTTVTPSHPQLLRTISVFLNLRNTCNLKNWSMAACSASRAFSARVPIHLMGFGVWVWGLGCGVWFLDLGVGGLRFGVWGVGFEVWGLRVGVWGFGCGVWGLGFEVEGSGPHPTSSYWPPCDDV